MTYEITSLTLIYVTIYLICNTVSLGKFLAILDYKETLHGFMALIMFVVNVLVFVMLLFVASEM